jgi:hypothetical protein
MRKDFGCGKIAHAAAQLLLLIGKRKIHLHPALLRQECRGT